MKTGKLKSSKKTEINITIIIYRNKDLFKFFNILAIVLLSCTKSSDNNKGDSVHKYTNRLINETSPYLLQHAHNPVNWYPWGEEAFKKALEENKPVFLSIGYSSCHWCHVMEHESFENEEIAALMNDNFICIKVDREERPDIDQLYMEYVQMTTGSGGWPMSVFLTAEQKPFYGGTYFPPQDKYGRPGFERILLSMVNYFHNEKDKLVGNIKQLEDLYANQISGNNMVEEVPNRSDWHLTLEQLSKYYEPVYGGIGNAPKFPAVSVFNLFLREYKITSEPHYLNMVTQTQRNMANGGIYDQIGGGFARYSVDEKWLVPHFEKMLYDNGQLVQLYIDTYLSTRDEFFLSIAEETLNFVNREMTSPDGGFYSSLDADSEGEEGKYYVWSKAEIDQILDQNANIVNAYYGVTEKGNFEGENILNVVAKKEDLAKQFNVSIEDVEKIIHQGKKLLLKEREKRIRPALDDKIISSWNSLMLSAYARTFQVTQKQEYAKIIKRNIIFIKNNLFDQKLMRTYKNGQSKYDAFIEDYAITIQAMLDSYEALFDPAYIEFAIELNDYANTHFWDGDAGGYFTASDNQEKLIKRMKDETDNSMPSGTGVMLSNNIRLFSLTEDEEYYTYAENILKKYSKLSSQNPYGYSSYLAGLDLFLTKPKEILIAKNKDHDISAYLKLVFGNYYPNKVVMVLTEGEKYSSMTANLVSGKKPIDGKITSYVCQNFQCSLPVFSEAELAELLKK